MNFPTCSAYYGNKVSAPLNIPIDWSVKTFMNQEDLRNLLGIEKQSDLEFLILHHKLPICKLNYKLGAFHLPSIRTGVLSRQNPRKIEVSES